MKDRVTPMGRRLESTYALCPKCGEIYWNILDSYYVNDPCAWRIEGYIVVICDHCRDEFNKWRSSPACLSGIQGNYYIGGN